MSRRIREESPTGFYHVMQRGIGKQILFEDDKDYIRYLEKLSECKSEIGFELPAYCLMNNHVHLLIHTSTLSDLSKTMKRIGTSYAAYYNTRYTHVGSVFQGRFLSEVINDDSYFLSCLRYIHNNPAKAGFGTREMYRWSSYGDYMRGLGLADVSAGLAMLGGIEQFEEFSKSVDENKWIDFEVSQASCEDGINIIRKHFGNEHESGQIVKMLKKEERNVILTKMKRAGLSNHQIELITGISRDVVRRV